jgi:hypothetical protein
MNKHDTPIIKPTVYEEVDRLYFISYDNAKAQLEKQAKSPSGTTMPDESIHP